MPSRAFQADFFQTLFVAIEENRGKRWYGFPAEFELTDSAVASLANVVLDLGPDDLIGAAYVKRLRQRGRKAGHSA